MCFVYIEDEIIETLRLMFGDMAKPTIEIQKRKLGLRDKLSKEDYLKIADKIRELCREMAGDLIAERIYNDLVNIIEKE